MHQSHLYTQDIRFIILALSLLGLLAGCKATPIATIDPDYGYGQPIRVEVDGKIKEKNIRLQYGRTKLREGALATGAVRMNCGGKGEGARFAFQFFAANDTREHWSIEDSMIHLVPSASVANPSKIERLAAAKTTLATIAPESTSRFSVAFSVQDADIKAKDSPLWGVYELRIYDRPVSDPMTPGEAQIILDRRVILGQSDPGLQLARVLFVFSVALLAVGAA